MSAISPRHWLKCTGSAIAISLPGALPKFFKTALAIAAVTVATLAAAPALASAAPTKPASFNHSLSGAVLTATRANAAPVMPAIASAALPNCPPQFGTASDLPCVLSEAHRCQDIGNYKGTHGIICVDLVIGFATGKNLEVHLQISAYCQNAAGLVQCADATMYGGTYDPTTTDKSWHWAKRCGHGNPANCVASGKNIFSHDEIIIAPGATDEIWGVAWEGSQIELPGDDYVELLGNLGTIHDTVTNDF